MALPDAATGTARFLRPVTAEWVIFRCADRWFSVPLPRTREILFPQAYTRLPGCGRSVVGLTGLRGRVVTVLDFGAVLGLSASSAEPGHRLLVLEQGARQVACAVEEVLAVADGRLEPLAGNDDVLQHLDLEPADVLGLGDFGGERFLALNSDRIVRRLLA